MARYTFICEQESSPFGDIVEAKRTVEFCADSLDQILPEFEYFLRGCSFHFNGNIDIVEEESYEEYREQSEFDFSNIPQNNWLFGNMQPQSATSEDTVYISEDIDLNLDYGAAQPAIDLGFDNTMDEKCSVCKLPKSIMVSEKCYDKECPKTSFLSNYDYKLSSDK